MGNNLDRYTGAGETANGPVPQSDRQTADRTHDRSLNASKDVPAFQPSGPDQQLASAETSKTEVTASPVGRPSKLSPAIAPRAPSKRPSRKIAPARPSARRQWVRSVVVDRGAGYPGRVPDGSGRAESLQKQYLIDESAFVAYYTVTKPGSNKGQRQQTV